MITNMTALRERLASRLRHLMDEHPALDTQVKVSKRSGVSQSTVQRVLSKDVAATLDVVEDIAMSFSLRPPTLLLLDEREAEMLSAWLALDELDRGEVVRFALLLGRRAKQPPGPRLDFEMQRDTPDLAAATLRASSKAPSNATQKENRKKRSSPVG